MHDTCNKPSVLSISWGAAGVDLDGPVDATRSTRRCNRRRPLGVTVCVASRATTVRATASATDRTTSTSLRRVRTRSRAEAPAAGISGARLSAKSSGTTAANGGATGGGVSGTFPLPDWQGTPKVRCGRQNPSGSKARRARCRRRRRSHNVVPDTSRMVKAWRSAERARSRRCGRAQSRSSTRRKENRLAISIRRCTRTGKPAARFETSRRATTATSKPRRDGMRVRDGEVRTERRCCRRCREARQVHRRSPNQNLSRNQNRRSSEIGCPTTFAVLECVGSRRTYTTYPLPSSAEGP